MLKIGCHLSASKGFLDMGKTALKIDANTFQFFSRNPRGSKAKALDEADVAAFLKLAAENDFAPLLAHAPYTMNPCSEETRIREFTQLMIREDLERLEHLPYSLYTLHPGNHKGQGAEAGIRQLITLLDAVLTAGQTTTVLLETMTGKGTEVGGTFEELRMVMEGVRHPEKLGICMDTCHVHEAGYDIINDLDGVLAQFDSILGLKCLRAVHLNDSLHEAGSRKDRHAQIGKGKIGLEALGRIINHPQLRHLPFYLETPNEVPGYGEEIALLRSIYTE